MIPYIVSDRILMDEAYREMLIAEASTAKKKAKVSALLSKLLNKYASEFKPRNITKARQMVALVPDLEDELEILDVIGNISNLVNDDSLLLPELEKVVDLV